MWWFMLAVTFMIIPGKKGINFYMCTGEDPNNDDYAFKKVRKTRLKTLSVPKAALKIC